MPHFTGRSEFLQYSAVCAPSIKGEKGVSGKAMTTCCDTCSARTKQRRSWGLSWGSIAPALCLSIPS